MITRVDLEIRRHLARVKLKLVNPRMLRLMWKMFIKRYISEAATGCGSPERIFSARCRHSVVRLNWGAILLALTVAGAAFLAFTIHSLPIGAYFWDDLVFEGTNYAISRGNLPVRDFWSPMVFPLYLSWLASVLNPGGWYLMLCLLQGLLALALAWPAMISRFSARSRHWVLLFIFLCAALPFNTSTAAAYPEFTHIIYYAGYYNRFAITLVGILLLMAVPARPEKETTLEWFMATLNLWLLFLTKISAFYVGVTVFAAVIGFRFSSFLRLRGWIWLALGVLPAFYFYDFLSLYMQQLGDIASNKLAMLKEELRIWRWQQFRHRSAIEIAAVSVAVGFSLWGLRESREKWRYAALAAFSFSGIAAIALFSLTSYGDLGVVPAAFPLLSLASNSQGPVRKGLHFACAVIVWSYVSAFATNLWFTGSCEASGIGTESIELNKHYYICRPGANRLHSSALYKALTEQSNKNSVRFSLLNDNDYAFYLNELEKAANKIRSIDPAPDARVIGLTFPSYYLAKLTGLDTPKNSRPWLLTRHEIFPATFGDGIPSLIGDAKYVAVERCFIQDNNIFLASQWDSNMTTRFSKVASTDCYDVYRKN